MEDFVGEEKNFFEKKVLFLPHTALLSIPVKLEDSLTGTLRALWVGPLFPKNFLCGVDFS